MIAPPGQSRRARATGARPARALLLPRLLAAASDVTALFGGSRTGAPTGGLHAHDVGEKRPPQRLAEDRGRELDRTGFALRLRDDARTDRGALLLVGHHSRSRGARLRLSAGVFADHDRTAIGARHGAAQEDQILIGSHLDDLEVGHRHPLVAHPARHALTLEHASGKRPVTDRAAVAEVLVRTVRARESR